MGWVVDTTPPPKYYMRNSLRKDATFKIETSIPVEKWFTDRDKITRIRRSKTNCAIRIYFREEGELPKNILIEILLYFFTTITLAKGEGLLDPKSHSLGYASDHFDSLSIQNQI